MVQIPGSEKDDARPAYSREPNHFGHKPYENDYDMYGCCLGSLAASQILLWRLPNPAELGVTILLFLCFISFIRIDLALVG